MAKPASLLIDEEPSQSTAFTALAYKHHQTRSITTIRHVPIFSHCVLRLYSDTPLTPATSTGARTAETSAHSQNKSPPIHTLKSAALARSLQKHRHLTLAHWNPPPCLKHRGSSSAGTFRPLSIGENTFFLVDNHSRYHEIDIKNSITAPALEPRLWRMFARFDRK